MAANSSYRVQSDRIRVVCVDRIGSFRFDSMTPEQILDRMEY